MTPLQYKNSLVPGRWTTFILLALCTFCGSCKKYLDAKPNRSQVVPATLADYQAMMDYVRGMNIGLPAAGEIGSDDVYVTATDWNAQASLTARNAYIWGRDLFNDNDNNDWTYPYQGVLVANLVLEGLEKMEVPPPDQPTFNALKGAALFYRSYAFYHLAQEFCAAWDMSGDNLGAGISLRLSSDINIPSTRATVKETYERILADTKAAAGLLPVTVLYKTRPGKAAAYGLLARAYLGMEDYTNAFLYADSCLQLNNKLLDYNSLTATLTNPVPQFNDEVLYHSNYGSVILTPPVGKVDSNLYKSYAANDLRKTVYFKAVTGGYGFYGSYTGTADLFGGLATDEIYLVRAECAARKGNAGQALTDLNSLLLKRFKTGTYSPYNTGTADAALALVLQERRKELVYRNTRWTDLRRLNRDNRFAVTQKRVLGTATYTLAPPDSRYVLPIPNKVIQATGMEQNP